MIPPDPRLAIIRAVGAAFIRRCEAQGIQETVEQVSWEAWPTLVRALDVAGAKPEILRPALEEAWLMAQWALAAEGVYGRRLLRLFRRARFDVSALPSEMTVWRGGRSTPSSAYGIGEAAAGLSWSTRREAACWYACQAWRNLNPDGTPLVVRRRVRREHVVYFRGSSRDMEILTDGPTEGLAIDGGPLEWIATAEVEAKRRWRITAELMAGPDTPAQRRQLRAYAFQLSRVGLTVDETLTVEKVQRALAAPSP